MTIADRLIEKGEARGEHNAARKIARRAFEQSYTLAHVRELTDLSEEELREIQAETAH